MEIDRLEKVLSHYIENSDISKISSLKAGQSTRVNIDTMESLLHCSYLWQITGGLFDITIGPLYKCWVNEDKTLKQPQPDEIKAAKKRVGMDLLRLDPDNMTVQVLQSGLLLDLGGYGKGYAIDRVIELLEEWEIENVLAHGGFSSIYAKGAHKDFSAWPVSVTNTVTGEVMGVVNLQNRAMSASGVEKGRHIINPETAKPVQANAAAWALGEDAATVDALTTAFMMMSADEVNTFCATYPDISALIIDKNSKIHSIDFPL